MADTMKLESKKNFVSTITGKSYKKIEELKEFLDLLETKIEWEFKHAEALDTLSKFHLNHLKDTPFEKIWKSMIKKADNEAYQTYELVESLKNAVYEPLKTKMKDFAHKISQFEDQFEKDCIKLTEARERLVDADCNYMYYSKALTDILGKVEFNSKSFDEKFYNAKTFSSLNSKMKTVDKKAKELESKTRTINTLIDDFKVTTLDNIKELEQMEKDRLQSMLDSLYQINVYQTNCDMNNKYDANNFNECVDNIDTKPTLENFSEMWNHGEMKHFDTYSFRPFDELISDDDVLMNKIDPEIEKELNLKINEFLQKSMSQNVEISSDDKVEFGKLMNDKINRYNFINSLSKNYNSELADKECYEKLSSLIKVLLRSIDKNEDSDYLRSILNISSKYYYDIEEDDAVIRTHITEGIRDNKIWDNHVLWGKSIFKDFRDIIRKFKLPKDHSDDWDEKDILRNVLFNRLLFYIDKLAYFDMNPRHLSTIWKRFTKEYSFTEEQRKVLNDKVVFEDNEAEEADFFDEENKQEKSRGSITKNVTKWMTQLEKFGSSAVNKMKTYIKKKEVDEDPIPDCHDAEVEIEGDETAQDKVISVNSSPEKLFKLDSTPEMGDDIRDIERSPDVIDKNELEASPESKVDEHKGDEYNVESTDTSKNNSECTPPKEMDSLKQEIDMDDILNQQPQSEVYANDS